MLIVFPDCKIVNAGGVERWCEFNGRNYGFSTTSANYLDANKTCTDNNTDARLLPYMKAGVHSFLSMQIDKDKAYWVDARNPGESNTGTEFTR